ncbi:uncharacterized protein BX663DRAFT_58760 [Cokeromyces recurvatus]|uniref:uncharacterized protein n=1 Tax=Cokeromyces recurvatus TaxID=90255 RepID=UPI0022202273|nr:uncharacterized protein BX663DRAFT_58760 [Cokeromyces recurvatus]KAI7903031.1 hypothetical protein BX663DRAFT_58760 [Cokeromyces recurvatus]
MDEEEFDIYGDYDFSQSDDILDEITTEKPITSNKRTRTNDDKEEILEESVKNLKVPRHEEQKDEVKKKEQKVQSAAVYQNNNNVTIPQALTQLRGISTKPTQSIYLGELHWYTTDKIIKEPLKKANLLEQIKEMTFFEHKNNGKSKGIVFFEFTNKDYALQAKTIFDNTS